MGIRLQAIVAAVCVITITLALAGCSDDLPPDTESAPVTTPSTVGQTSTEQTSRIQSETNTAESEEETNTPSAELTDEPVASVSTGEEANTPLPFDPSVLRGTLSNGLDYYIKHNDEPRDRAQLSLVVKAGSVLEEEDQRGLAHFIEHMAFNGTEHFPKQGIVDYIASIGGGLNAATGFDDTIYWLEIPTTDPEMIETAFQILSDWAYAIDFTPEEIELERGVILEEWRQSLGYGSRAQESLTELLFGSSRYAERSPIGVTEVIESAPIEQFLAYYERWYRPDLMALIAVGDFDTDLIEAKVKQYFAPPPEGEASHKRAAVAAPTDKPSFDVPDNNAPLVNVFTDPEAPSTQVHLIRKVTPEITRDLTTFRRKAAEQLALMMFNARLLERGQESDPPWFSDRTERATIAERFPLVNSLDILTFSIRTERDGVEAGLTALLEEIQRVRQHGFTAAELEREQSNLLSKMENEYLERDRLESGQLAQSYQNHFLNGQPALSAETQWALYQQLLPEITLAETNTAAATWAELRNTALSVEGPEGIDGGEEGGLAASLQAHLHAANDLVVEPYVDDFEQAPLLAAKPTPGSIVDEQQIDAIDAVQWTLSNGITVIAKQTDFRNNEIQFAGFSPGGHSLVADADYASAVHAAQLVSGSGAGAHDKSALDRLLAGRQVSVTPYIGELFEGLYGNAAPADIESLFQLITLYVTEPRLDPDYFSTYVAGLRSRVELLSNQPDAVLLARLNELLTQNHLRRRSVTPELLDALNIDRARAVYVDRFADLGDAAFVFVGAFDWNELRRLTTTYLASLPTAGRAEEPRDFDIDPPAGIVDEVIRSGVEPLSNTVWTFAGAADWDSGQTLAFEVAGEMLGIRLSERVREALGGTYRISVDTRTAMAPDQEYRAEIIFNSDPDRLNELLDAVATELDWIRGGGEQSYLDNVKQQLRTNREGQTRTNEFWLEQIHSAIERGGSFAEIGRFDEQLESITLEQVAAIAQLGFPKDRFVRVVLLPNSE